VPRLVVAKSPPEPPVSSTVAECTICPAWRAAPLVSGVSHPAWLLAMAVSTWPTAPPAESIESLPTLIWVHGTLPVASSPA